MQITSATDAGTPLLPAGAKAVPADVPADVPDAAPATSGLKSFELGALDIPSDDTQTTPHDLYYRTGQWARAALEVGVILAQLA
jgi:hypothetical protein